MEDETEKVLDLDDLAFEIQGRIRAAGGEIKTDLNSILTALAGHDVEAHITDGLDDDALGQLLDDFEAAWKKTAAEYTEEVVPVAEGGGE